MPAINESQPKARQTHPLRQAAIVLYATLAILWLAIPQSVSNWSRDYLPDFVQPATKPITETVERFANATGIPHAYEYAHALFQSATKP
ncbi:MAG: hypothetical protein KF835_02665 [Xanthobacteraceae bacterium]|nr:hypothetical protein [Xanthobacteraceae bacterium]